MNSKHSISSCIVSLLLAMIMLLTVLPAAAESLATPTDLASIEETETLQEAQTDPESEEDETEPNTENPADAENSNSTEDPDKAEEPDAGDHPEDEEEKKVPYLACLKAGARLYSDKDCYLKQQFLEEDAVVLVMKTTEKSSEILYAYASVTDETVPGKAYVHVDDLTPLTEEETTAWIAEEHADAIERMEYPLERLTFGTVAANEKADDSKERPEAEAGEDGENNSEINKDRDPAEEYPADKNTTEGNPAEANPMEKQSAGEKIAEEKSVKTVPAGEKPATDEISVTVTEAKTQAESPESIHTTGYIAPDHIEVNALFDSEEDEAENRQEEQLPIVYSAGDDGEIRAGFASYYNGKEQGGYLPNTRTQSPFGACWAFATIGAMEIDLIRSGLANSGIDLSELFLAYYAAHNYPYAEGGAEGDSISFNGTGAYEDNGGSVQWAYRLLSNLIGTVNEDDAPYVHDKAGAGELDVNGYGKIAAQVNRAYSISTKDRDAIKQAILEHGSVAAGIYVPENDQKSNGDYIQELYEGSEKCYVVYRKEGNCLAGTYPHTNHSVLLVGWDDNFSSSNYAWNDNYFKNGAWLVRNSWTTDNSYGLNGYFWLSYQDASLNYRYDSSGNQYENETIAFDAVNNSQGNEIADYGYSYDKAGLKNSGWTVGSTATVSTTFTMKGNEKLQAVGVETGSNNQHIQVDVKVNGKTVAGGQTEAKYKGFYRIMLDKTYAVKTGTQVEIVVTHTSTDGSNVTVLYEQPGTVSLGAIRITAGQGGGFFLNGEPQEGDPMIKLYTQKNGTTVNDPTRIYLNKAEMNLKSGESQKLEARIDPSTAAGTELIWTSSDNNVAIVEDDGTVYAAPGGSGTKTAVITAMAPNGVSDTCKVTVKLERVTVTGVSIKNYNKSYLIDENTSGIEIGSILVMQAELAPKYPNKPGIIWESSNTAVLSVSDKGDGTCEVTIKDNGKARITATAKDTSNGTISDYVDFTVDILIPVTDIRINPSACTMLTDSGYQLAAQVYPSNATNQTINWSSSDPSVATVNNNGYVWGVKDGTTVITAASAENGKMAACTVTVIARDPVEAFVYRMYRVCLQREPDTEGLNYWVSQLKSGGNTGAEIIYGFYCSAEMISRRLSYSDYLDRAYEGIMNRLPDSGGKAYWLDFMNRGVSYAYIVAGFTNSEEFTNLCASYGIIRGDYKSPEPRDQNPGITGYVNRLYTKMLGRIYDESGMNYWCGELLKNHSKENLLNIALIGFMHSDEFMNKGLDDKEFVKVLYRTFLDRECDERGLQYWIGQLQSGRTRDQVAAGFAYSDEFREIMAQFGL